MKSFLLQVSAILLAAMPVAAADSVSGKWKIHQSIVGNESDMACNFTQTGDDLAGTCDMASGAVKLSGKVSENKITWTVVSEYNGAPLTLKYSGKLASATKMTGTVNVDPYGVDGEFTATPEK